MKKFLSALCATALTASVAVTGVLPANAAPVYMPKASTAQPSDVIQVQDGMRWKKRFNRDRARFNDDRFFMRRGDFRRGDFRSFDGPRAGWYNGHRGYRNWRRGYRYHDGFWFPAAAFLTGAIIGGAIANSNTYYRGGGGSAHVEWCYDRYRSYRAYDNTWQPYNGPRRECISPYI
jgi:hypothetical protein